jgi:ubiquinone/menaquinone biosynthesis C-methylase UbiE
VVLLDLQLEMLQLARGRLTNVANAAYTQADAMRIPFRSESFDGVLVVLMLGEVPDQSACLAEIRRVLRRDGVLTVAETRRDSDFIPLPALRTLVEPLGFRFIDRRGMRWEYTARFARA